MSELRVPPAAVPLLREGARFVIRMAADNLGDSDDIDGDLDRRRRLEDLWGLLDVLGWQGDVTEPVEITPSHQAALKATVDLLQPAVEQWLAELPHDHPTRAQRADERRLLVQLGSELGTRAG